MTENNQVNIGQETQPQVEPDDTQIPAAPTDGEEIRVPIKFNKQVKMLDIEEASVLAQKGMKFDMISGDFERIKKLAAADKMSIGEFVTALEKKSEEVRLSALLQRCSGDEELARHIADLEKSNTDEVCGTGELFEQFPEISDLSQLPDEVVGAAQLRGSSVLDEYLRYRRREEIKALREMQSMSDAARSSMGAQSNHAAPDNPERNLFIKALWGN